MPQDTASVSGGGLARVEAQRRHNMRQLLQRATRIVNRDVVAGLHERGYAQLRSTHTTLLSNMDLAGSTVTVVAERAGITKQAMGRLAAELEEAGYLKVRSDPQDGRARVLQLTKRGTRLMLESLEVMAALQGDYAECLGEHNLAGLLNTLEKFIERCGEK